VSATDPDGTTPALTAEDIPTNGSFTDNGNGTGSFSFDPDFTQSGVYNVRFIASDGASADTEIVAITVNDVGQAPILAAIGPRSVNEGSNLSFGVSATDPDGTTPALTAEDVPVNASFTDNGNGTGSFSFDPDFTQSGVYNVRFIASDGTLADTEMVAITVTEFGTGHPPLPISDLNAFVDGDSIRLTWSPVTVDTLGNPVIVDRYVIYRDTKAYFTLEVSDSIGGLPFGTTQFYDNNIGGSNVVGDTVVNYFYAVKSVALGGMISGSSNRAGEYDFQIVTTATTDFNLVSLPFSGTGITNAQQLVTSMGGTLNVLTVNNFIPSSQSYQAWFAAGFGSNFAVSSGKPFQVNAARNFVWSITGQVPDSGSLSYGIVVTSTTDYSLIMIPFEYEDILLLAQDVIDNVPGLLNTLNEFVPSSQSYRSRFAAGFGTNFTVRAGRVYQANGKVAGSFPAE
jgi:hypothetical protein